MARETRVVGNPECAFTGLGAPFWPMDRGQRNFLAIEKETRTAP
jgi:glycerol kinase